MFSSDPVPARRAGYGAILTSAEVAALGADLRRHDRLLRTLRLRPHDLAVPTDARTAVGWAGRRLHLLLLAGLAAIWLAYLSLTETFNTGWWGILLAVVFWAATSWVMPMSPARAREPPGAARTSVSSTVP